ncbi:MAG: hypothetical protein Q8Q29_02060 [Actinomycetota bacterium]|nr:hypothetical protein [Actinomycetota bacterium]
MSKVRPHLFEDGDHIYLVAPVSPFEPNESEIEEYAFASDLKKGAPNPNFLWLRGNYVEADNPNANGHQWTAGELAIKSLTPQYCPVTVMHDPRTAVGLIADTRLLTPETDRVPRSRIETALAIWAHRFPDVAEEIAHNYEQGSLMQSMECQAPFYSCAECGQTFHKLPGGEEEAQWCAHLAENPNAGRILGGVTFTGTGLIFGSRGARGAYSEAHLEQAVQEEIVAAHQELHDSTSRRSEKAQRSVIPMEKMEIARSEYDELKGRPTKDELAAAKDQADDSGTKLKEAESAVETAEAAQKKAERERDEFKDKAERAEEEKRAGELSTERLDKLGKGFKDALGEKTQERLGKQASDMEDDDWEARLGELEELTEVKRDAGSEEDEGAAARGGDLSREETASTPVGSRRSGGSEAPSGAARASVIGGLVRSSGRRASEDDK